MEERMLLLSYLYTKGFGRAFFVVNGLIGQATIMELEERIKQTLIKDGSMSQSSTLIILSYQILESTE